MNTRTVSAFLFVMAFPFILNCQNLVKDDIFKKTVVKDHELIKKNGITAITEYNVAKGKEAREKSVYDGNGDLVEYISYGLYGTHTEVKTKTYDNNHHVIMCITYWKETGPEKDTVPKFKQKETWKYDSQGNISERIVYYTLTVTDGLKTTYTYDSKNRLTEEYNWYAETFTGHHKFVYSYEEKDGKLSKLTKNRVDLYAEMVNGKADLLKLKTGQPVLEQVTIYTYGKDGKLHSESFVFFYSDGTTFGWYYTYDATGNIIQKTTTGTKKYKCPDDYYEYDTTGKMIKSHGTCAKKIKVYKYDALGLLAEEGYISKDKTDDYKANITYEVTKK